MWESTDAGSTYPGKAAQGFTESVCDETGGNYGQAICGRKEYAGIPGPACVALRSALNEIAEVCKLLMPPCQFRC